MANKYPDLELVLKEARSIQTYSGDNSLEFIGIVKSGKRHIRLYEDVEEKEYYSKTFYEKDGKLITEYEYIFGRPEPPRRTYKTRKVAI